MLFKARLLACAATMAFAFSVPAMADLVGTSVTGSMNIAGYDSTNFFDPTVGFVPDGTLNATLGTTMPISADDVEFGFANDTNTVSVDFTANTLELLALSSEGTPADITFTFTDTAFAGLQLSEVLNVSDFSASLTGDTITLHMPEFETGGYYLAYYGLTPSDGDSGSDDGSNDDGPNSPTPEPASLLLFGSGLAACGLVARRKLASA